MGHRKVGRMLAGADKPHRADQHGRREAQRAGTPHSPVWDARRNSEAARVMRAGRPVGDRVKSE